MRFVPTSAAVFALASLFVVPTYAGQRGNSGAHGPSAAPKAPATHGSPKTHGPSSTKAGPSSTAHGPSAGPSKGGPKTTSGASPVAKGKTTTATTTANTSSSATTTSSATSSTPTTLAVDFTSGRVGKLLTKNTALSSKLETRLAALGYSGSVYQAGYGFKNLGQFVAATNVSQNLGIPFDQLKLLMTGLSVAADGTVLHANKASDGTIVLVDPADATSPASTKSLGQSIQTLRSNVDATTSAQTATQQADAEIKSTASSR